MKAVLVDDEELAVRDLRMQLEKLGVVHILGEWTNPEVAVDQAAKLKPDVVFLDIDMPGMSGIEAAAAIQNHLPDIEIVFVTAYDAYAIEAFELNAIDYLLKPFSLDRLRRTVDRLQSRRQPKPMFFETGTVPADVAGDRSEPVQPRGGDGGGGGAGAGRPRPMLRCFHVLELDRGTPEAIQWRTYKAQELFLFLLLHRGQQIRKDVLLDILWTDIDYKKGYTQLYTAVYQIRKTIAALQLPLVLASNEKGYRLDVQELLVDTEVWERGISELPAISTETIGRHLELAELYRGDYLADYDFMWAEAERQRLRFLWYDQMSGIAAYLKENLRLSEAISFYMRILEKFPLAEDIHFELIKLYWQFGDPESGERHYASLTRLLEEELGAEPSEDIRAWMEGRPSRSEPGPIEQF